MSNTPETHAFQAEIQQLLDIVIHSLYTDKEIFIRELISNAADALEKLRFLQSSGQNVRDENIPLKISIHGDDQAKTVTFTDTGIGMTHDELVQNLGTIARSGSKEFIQQLAGQKDKPLDLIGQFGVGFYSAFMVADKVIVSTRSHQSDQPGWRWSSSGAGNFTIEPADDLPRGTAITVHLKETEKSFSQVSTLTHIIQRYSSFVPFPIELDGKPVSTVQAIWTRNKSEIKEEEYQEFFRFFAHGDKAPRYRLHFTADAPLAIRSLLFVPHNNIEKFGFMRQESEIHIYCRRVLIQSNAKGLLPDWLRFVKGVVESDDLPLNISRETMQDTNLMQKIGKVITGRFLKMLDEESESHVDAYAEFYHEFGRCIKEGVATDFVHREALTGLLRFESSALDAGKLSSLADYVTRMPSDQKEIYYLFAPTRAAAESSPYFEVFKARKVEVLFLHEPYDEFVMDHVREFDGKKLVAAEKATLEIDAAERQSQSGLKEEDVQVLVDWFKEQFKDRLAGVTSSARLMDSPALVVDDDPHMTTNMRRIMRSIHHDAPTPGAPEIEKLKLEINPRHPIMVRLNRLRFQDAALAKQIAAQVIDNALMAAGLLEDPRTMIRRLNELLEKMMPQ